MPKAVVVILIVLGVLFLIGIVFSIFAAGFFGSKVKEGLQEAGIENIQELSQYPDSYKAANLPEYPDAEVVHLGNKEAQPAHDNGIVLYVNTTDEVAKVVDFYNSRLTADGWNADVNQSSSQNDSTLVTRIYTKDDQQYTLTVSRDGENNTTNVVITWSLETDDD